MLETLGDPNVYHMAIEEPERNQQGMFDLSEIISDQSARILNEKYSDYLKDALENPDGWRWEVMPKLIRNMQALGLRGGPGNLEIIGMREKFTSLKNSPNWNSKKFTGMTDMAAYMEEMGCGVDLTKEETEFITKRFKDTRNSTTIIDFATDAALLVELGIDPKITSDDIHNLVSKAEELRENRDWVDFVFLASRMKLLGIANVAYSEDDIQDMKDEVASNIGGNWENWINRTANLQILLSVKPSNLAQTNEMPEQRTF